MGLSYKEESENYKNKKKAIVDGYDNAQYKKKKKKKKKSKSDHKHEYIPVIFHKQYTNFNGTLRDSYFTGNVCKKCGRVPDVVWLFSFQEEQLEKFKKENKHYLEIELPKDWNWFDNKYVTLPEIE